MDPSEPQSQTPHFPTYMRARETLRVLDGVSPSRYQHMIDQIQNQRGNPQAQADWSDPETWIDERLTGDAQVLARRLWQESGRTINPRYTRGTWLLARRHELLVRNPADDTLRLTPRGHAFLALAESPVVAEIDVREGVLVVLRIVAERGSGRRGDLLPPYVAYCRATTTVHSERVITSFLYTRLVNLTERGLIIRRGVAYQVTDAGLAYLAAQTPDDTSVAQRDILKQAAQMNAEARTQLAAYLAAMDPFRFEELIALLLQEMGYTDVETTAPVNDKGVDVVANIELGISSVREVVQVKRQKGSIHRRILDELRGSLHRFHAVRGTIITTGGFSRGTVDAAFERGAAPITLIDGEKLLDLLIQYQLGVTRKTIEYLEFNPQQLAAFGPPASEVGR